METIKVKYNCRHFKGYAPCKKYWENKIYNCEKCKFYDPIKERILLIKLDAIGDVLRTTPIATCLKKKYPRAHLTWLVESKSLPILKNNYYIDKVLPYDFSSINTLKSEKFDLVINLDKSEKSSALINLIKAKKKLGYALNENGKIYPLNEGAYYHYKICLDNWGMKTKNKKTYQEMMADIAEIPYNHEGYTLNLDKERINFAAKFLEKYNIKSTDLVIGLNTGCGSVYPHKKWTIEGCCALIDKLVFELGAKVILLGGAFEIELNYELYRKHLSEENYEIQKRIRGDLIDATRYNSLTEFAYLLDLCDIIVTGDTAALHLAIALKKKIVALFGPTPAQEIDLYGLGKKIVADMDCINCYDQFTCTKRPNCMDSIKVDEVFKAIKALTKK